MNTVKKLFKQFEYAYKLDKIQRQIERIQDRQEFINLHEYFVETLKKSQPFLSKNIHDFYSNLENSIAADRYWAEGRFNEMLPKTHFLIKELESNKQNGEQWEQEEANVAQKHLYYRAAIANYLLGRENEALDLLKPMTEDDKNPDLNFASKWFVSFINFSKEPNQELTHIHQYVDDDKKGQGFDLWADSFFFLINKDKTPIANSELHKKSLENFLVALDTSVIHKNGIHQAGKNKIN